MLVSWLTDEPPRPAAVLVPVVARLPLTVLLTQRTDTLPSHAGQIAFPGGKIEAHDRDAIAAALREAQEEIGLDPGLVEPLGYLDAYRTGTGYRIYPVVALVKPGFTLTLDAVRLPMPSKFRWRFSWTSATIRPMFARCAASSAAFTPCRLNRGTFGARRLVS